MHNRTNKLESHWTQVNDLTIHARVATRPPGGVDLPLALVHGLVVSSRYMVPVAELLAADYPVYIPDQPGFGESDKPDQALNVDELADFYIDWMDAVGLEQAAFLGNSLGCQIIVALALRHPERIICAVLQGPTMDRHARNLPQQVWRMALDSRLERPSQILIMLRDYWLAGMGRFAATLRYALEDRIEEKLPYVRVPTLVVRGKRDPVASQGWSEEVTELLPDGRLVVIPGGSHTMNYSMPLELARVVRPFLQEQMVMA